MMPALRYWLAGAMCCTALWGGCSLTSVAGGSASEGEARTVVAGVILDEEGVPATGRLVDLLQLRLSARGDSVIARYRVWTDSAGWYRFEDIPRGEYVLQCSETGLPGIAVSAKITVTGEPLPPPTPLVLGPRVAARGRILPPAEGLPVDIQDIMVWVPGLSGVHPDAEGLYTLPGVPKGRFDICFSHGGTINYLPVEVRSSAGDTAFIREIAFAFDSTKADRVHNLYDNEFEKSYLILFVPYLHSPQESLFYDVRYYRLTADGGFIEVDDELHQALLIDDFDDGDVFSLIHGTRVSSVWSAFNHASAGGTVIINPSGVDVDFSRGLSVTGAFKGQSFSMQCIADDRFGPAATGIACSLRVAQRQYADLTRLNSIRFWARGRGTLRLTFWSARATLGYQESMHWGQAGYTITLPADWQLHTVNVADLALPLGSSQLVDGLSWQMVRDSVSAVGFVVAETSPDTVEFWLDDFYLNGVTKDLIVR